MSGMKDILLVGFGAVGAMYSLALKQSGLARVTVVARSNYEAVKARGMNFKSQIYGDIEGWKPDRLCSSVAEAADQAYSHIILTTKTVPELLKTPQLLSPFLSSPYSNKFKQPIYVLLQNGLGLEADLYNAIKALKQNEEPKIVSAALYIGTRLLEPNLVEHSDFSRLSIGVYRSKPNVLQNDPEETAILEELATILRAGRKQVTIEPEIQRIKFVKNVWNIVFGPVATLSRYTLSAVFRPPLQANGNANAVTIQENTSTNQTPSQLATAHIPHANSATQGYTIPFILDALDEVIALGNVRFPPSADGVPAIDPALALQTLESSARIFAKPTSTERPSILVDCENGRPMEVEVIVGEVVRMGRDLGVPMPIMETFYALLLIIQTQLLQARQAQQ